MTEKKKQQHGGNRKTAPEGYYSSREARERLGLSTSTFIYYVQKGKIQRHVPPLRKEGFYDKKEIDRMAAEIAVFFETELAEEEVSPITTRVVQPEDAQDIYAVLAEGFAWQSASAEQRRAWYEVNPMIDYVVLYVNTIVGYVTAVPYTAEALADIMAGRRRAWHMEPEDILPYIIGRSYDLYVGAAVRQDTSNPRSIARRLLSGFITFIQGLAESGITIQKLYAVSAEEDGRRLCRKLGFVQQETQPGDLFQDARFVLDLQTSDSRFARQYREITKRT